MKERTQIFLLLIFLFCVVCVKSQNTAVLYGKVTDSETGEALDEVKISTINAQNSINCQTDSRGNYEITLPANANIKLVVTSMTHEPDTLLVFLESGTKKRLNILLLPTIIYIAPIEVVEDRYRITGLTRIDMSKIENILGPRGGIENLVKMLGGTSSSNELTSQYSVRGGNFDENLVYINEIEVYRPFLVRSGEQEGLSIINPNMVGSLLFSAGGFGANYGDRMSSVLDITYKKPEAFGGKVSLSLLGATAYVEGLINKKLGFNLGFRQQSTQYILNSMETQGTYRPSFTDLQTYVTYSLSKKIDLSFLGIYSRNVYKVVPEDRTTNFGSLYETMRIDMYFDGQEVDKFTTLLGAGTLTYRPNNKNTLKFIVSSFNSQENEIYDIQSQYWLYELESVETGSKTQITAIDRGIGTFLEHARDYLTLRVFNLEHKGSRIMGNGILNWGLKYQHEYVRDKMSEWKMVDSAGYTIPYTFQVPGNTNDTTPPLLLQNVLKSSNTISSNRFFGFAQKNWVFKKDTNIFTVVAGLRFQYWDFNNQFLLSPRTSATYKPKWNENFLFRFATGVYSQSPLYREYRDLLGNVNENIKAQNSYHFIGTMDLNFKMWDRKFLFVTEAYYKYITNLIPYEIDNLRIRYAATNSAVGYVAGIDFRVNGEFIESIESWATMTLLQTQEDVEGDNTGFKARPTDQRFIIKLFFQDYVPRLPWMRTGLNFVFGTGLPFTRPQQTDFSTTHRLPSYMRLDWSMSFRIKDTSSKWAQKTPLKYVKSIWLYAEIYNLFYNQNTASYIWVADYDNRYYAVPNYLTPRQLNVKLTVDF